MLSRVFVVEIMQWEEGGGYMNGAQGAKLERMIVLQKGWTTLPFKNEILCSIECVITVYVIDEVGIMNENAYN